MQGFELGFCISSCKHKDLSHWIRDLNSSHESVGEAARCWHWQGILRWEPRNTGKIREMGSHQPKKLLYSEGTLHQPSTDNMGANICKPHLMKNKYSDFVRCSRNSKHWIKKSAKDMSRLFAEEEVQMAKRPIDMKTCLEQVVIREIYTNMAASFHFTPVRITTIQNPQMLERLWGKTH